MGVYGGDYAVYEGDGDGAGSALDVFVDGVGAAQGVALGAGLLAVAFVAGDFHETVENTAHRAKRG